MMARHRAVAVACVAAIAMAGLTSASRAEPVKIRISWVVVPGELTPIMLEPPGIARHAGISYTLEHTHFAGGPLAVTAFAANEVDVTGFGFTTIATAIQGAGIDDLRVIGDVAQDGVDGWYKNGYFVRKDSPIRTIEDLKGRVAAVNVKGGLIDLPLRAMLRKHGLDDGKDVTIIEVALPNMKAILLDGKADLVGTLQPFSEDAQFRDNSRVLFTGFDAAGRQEVSTLVTRASFIAKNRAALVDFLEDYIRVVRWYLDPANHRQAIQIVADFMKQPAALFDSWAFTRGDQYRNPDALPDPTLLQANIDWLGTLGYLKGPIDMKRHTDASLAREAVARISP
jgi:ABC-type nitrate/sulfonate/bicarbonate transport system substrate-binding protein